MNKIKKILLATAAVLVSTSSLFAYTSGSIVLYPEAGIGFAGGQVKVWSGNDLSGYFNNEAGVNFFSFKNAEMTAGLYWSAGCNAAYYFNESVSLTGGLFIDKNSFEVVWKTNSPIHGDLKCTVDLYRLTIPVGLRFNYGLLMVGGGLYLGEPVSYKETIETELSGNKLKGKYKMYDNTSLGCSIDAGLNFKITDTKNLLVFLRFKTDITYSYDKDDMITDIRNRSLSLHASYGFQLNKRQKYLY